MVPGHSANSLQKADLTQVLRLPLTEDRYLKHTVEMSLGYYRDVMAVGR